MKGRNKTQLAKELGVSRQSLYYHQKQPSKDWKLKVKIEQALRDHSSYGHKRLATHLGIGKSKILRVMNLFGIKPYRRRGKKFKYVKQKKDKIFDNLLFTNQPLYPNHIWASDFTHIAKFKNKWVYLATILDLYTRRIVGFSILMNHSTQLVINALMMTVINNSLPKILNSDQGSEYASKDYTNLCKNINIQQSMSNPGCPWENGYQESFYDKFKIDLADTSRFETLGELVYNIYRQIYYYNHNRIHTSLNMAPIQFENQYNLNSLLIRQNINSLNRQSV